VARRRELLALVKSVEAADAKQTPLLERARKVVAGGGALVIPIVTRLGAKILVLVDTDDRPITVIDVPELTMARLILLVAGPPNADPPGGWLGRYTVNYMPDQPQRWPEWLDAINDIGAQLWNLIGARLDAGLKARGLTRDARIVWLPSGTLGLLPLGLAENPTSKRRLGDDYEILYAPNLEMISAAQQHTAAPAASSLAVIINPTGDLAGTEKEGAIVASHFRPEARTSLQGQAATVDTVLGALKGKSYWHFASHGTFAWGDARQSGLVMHDQDRLSVERLAEAGGLGRPRLVVLSACETGLYGFNRNPDEFIGLPGAFMALGAAGVLGTLWPVDDTATALLIAKFYELHMDSSLSPPAALRQAQRWLRDATSDELNGYSQSALRQGRMETRHLNEIAGALSPEGLAKSRNSAVVNWNTSARSVANPGTSDGKQPAPKPYAHPYFWAGFIHTGL
jgi:CHAT domain-containing protein